LRLSAWLAVLVLVSALPTFYAQVRLTRRRSEMIVRTTPHWRRQAFYSDLLLDPRAAKEVRGVRAGSAAERAGLKDGQRMTSLSIAYGDPTRDIEVGVRDAGADAKLTWTPQGDPIDVPQVAPRDASSDCGGP